MFPIIYLYSTHLTFDLSRFFRAINFLRLIRENETKVATLAQHAIEFIDLFFSLLFLKSKYDTGQITASQENGHLTRF